MSYRGRSKGNYGIRKAQRFHARRSNRAKRIDEGLRAPLAKSTEQWMQQPNRFDLPDVDTPKKTQEEKHRETVTFQPKRLTHIQIKQRLAVHRLYGNTH